MNRLEILENSLAKKEAAQKEEANK